MKIQAIELIVAAVLSMGVHYLAYEQGNRYDHMDMSQHEDLIHQIMKRKDTDYQEH